MDENDTASVDRGRRRTKQQRKHRIKANINDEESVKERPTQGSHTRVNVPSGTLTPGDEESVRGDEREKSSEGGKKRSIQRNAQIEDGKRSSSREHGEEDRLRSEKIIRKGRTRRAELDESDTMSNKGRKSTKSSGRGKRRTRRTDVDEADTMSSHCGQNRRVRTRTTTTDTTSLQKARERPHRIIEGDEMSTISGRTERRRRHRRERSDGVESWRRGSTVIVGRAGQFIEEPTEVEEKPVGVENEKGEFEDDAIVKVCVHAADSLDVDMRIVHPAVMVHLIGMEKCRMLDLWIEAHLVDEETGGYVIKSRRGGDSENACGVVYPTDQRVDYVLPVMTKPYNFRSNSTTTPWWKEEIVINEQVRWIQDRKTVVAVFEVVDFGRRVGDRQGMGDGDGWFRIAWGFLRLNRHTDRQVRVQLFRYPHSSTSILKRIQKFTSGAIAAVRTSNLHEPVSNFVKEVRHAWRMGKLADCGNIPFALLMSENREKINATLYVTVTCTPSLPARIVTNRPVYPTDIEHGKLSVERLLMVKKKAKDSVGSDGASRKQMKPKWRRLPGQRCQIPNSIACVIHGRMTSNTLVRYSRSGNRLLCTGCRCQSGAQTTATGRLFCGGSAGWTSSGIGQGSFEMRIYDICAAENVPPILARRLVGSLGIVFDADWSPDDSHIVTASGDGSIRIWYVEEGGTSAQRRPVTFQNSMFMYAARFHPIEKGVMVCGGYDTILRVWSYEFVNDSAGPDGEQAEQMTDDSLWMMNGATYKAGSPITALGFAEQGELLFVGDSVGTVHILAYPGLECNKRVNSMVPGITIKPGLRVELAFSKTIDLEVDPLFSEKAVRTVDIQPWRKAVIVSDRRGAVYGIDGRMGRVITRYECNGVNLEAAGKQLGEGADKVTSKANFDLQTMIEHHAGAAFMSMAKRTCDGTESGTGAAVSPCGTFVIASVNGKPCIWKADSGVQVNVGEVWEKVGRRVGSVAWHPWDHTVAISSELGVVVLTLKT
ncbi:WD40-repeat-containing domain protein [Cladochytrium replicatum]|nr:WD40-repeat-containing domain protein [Cladochytrium replicatum]